MQILQFVADALGDASYVVIDGPLAAVVDPQRDVRPYLAVAREHGAEITHVFETHVHNDYVSGAMELAQRGARIVVPARSGLLFPHDELADGGELVLGSTTLRAVAAPGHTYEHTAYLAVDAAGTPQAAFTGGALLVASAGRTDLLGPEHTEELTRLQWESAHRLSSLLAASAEVLPTHGAGSFCSASGVTSERRSFVGTERGRNPVLALPAFEAFRAVQLANPSPIPDYYRYMAPINRQGPRVYTDPPVPQSLAGDAVEEVIAAGAIPVDLRRRSEFVRGHIPGSLGVEEGNASLAYIR